MGTWGRQYGVQAVFVRPLGFTAYQTVLHRHVHAK